MPSGQIDRCHFGQCINTFLLRYWNHSSSRTDGNHSNVHKVVVVCRGIAEASPAFAKEVVTCIRESLRPIQGFAL